MGATIGHNINLLSGLAQNNIGSSHKGKLNNILMHVRKYGILFNSIYTPVLNKCRCLQHPYLYSEDIEPKGLDPKGIHEKLIDASGKLRLLRSLLPKLKERGHRVLLFSQVKLERFDSRGKF